MKKRFLGIICLLYSGIIGYVWFSDKLKNYLAPQMQIYIKIAIIPLLIIGLVMLVIKRAIQVILIIIIAIQIILIKLMQVL